MNDNPYDLWDNPNAFPPPAPQPDPPTVVSTEAHSKLQRNLSKALDRHDEILSDPLGPDTPHHARRLVAETATSTIKAALTTDRTALKARQDRALEMVFLRVLFHRKRLGYDLSAKEIEQLRDAPRSDLEAALGPRQLAEYDRMFTLRFRDCELAKQPAGGVARNGL